MLSPGLTNCCRSKVLTTLALDSINLLEQLTELRKTLYLGLPVCCKRIWRRNSQIEEMQRAKYNKWEGVQNFHALSEHATLPKSSRVKSPRVHQPEPVRTGSFGVLWRLHNLGMIDQILGHWWLILPPAPLPFPQRSGVGLKVPTLQSQGWFPWQPTPSFLLSKSHLCYHKLRCGWKEFVMNIKTPFFFKFI